MNQMIEVLAHLKRQQDEGWCYRHRQIAENGQPNLRNSERFAAEFENALQQRGYEAARRNGFRPSH